MKKILILGAVLVVLISAISASTKETTNEQKEDLAEIGQTQKVSGSDVPTNGKDGPGLIELLREREFPGGEIVIEETLVDNGAYTSYIISYPSDDLKIFGMMNVPNGDGPFPVVVLNHGYYNASSFTSGDGTRSMADILATDGYITLASDYRGHGKSENDSGGSRGHRPEYAIDVLNLIASIPSLNKANKDKIGMWGHSLGGEVALRVAEATDMLGAVVLWAPTSGRVSDNARFYGGRRDTNQQTNDTESAGTSPINYLEYISAPISLHQGLSDTEVDPEWSKELNKSLESEGKEVEYFEYPGQDHNFRNLGWDEISKNTLDFYEKHLK